MSRAATPTMRSLLAWMDENQGYVTTHQIPHVVPGANVNTARGLAERGLVRYRPLKFEGRDVFNAWVLVGVYGTTAYEGTP